MRIFTFVVAVFAAAFFATPSMAQSTRGYDLAQLSGEVRTAVEAARRAQTRAIGESAKAQTTVAPNHIRFTGTGGDTYAGECAPCTSSAPQRHGFGVLSWPDGEFYAGENIRGGDGGLKHGHGVYVFVNGRMYEGQFSADQFTGYGVMWDENGNVREQGLFLNGSLVR